MASTFVDAHSALHWHDLRSVMTDRQLRRLEYFATTGHWKRTEVCSGCWECWDFWIPGEVCGNCGCPTRPLGEAPS